MAYNSSFNGNSLGVPTSSFASRGKGAHIKPLNLHPAYPSTTAGSHPPTTPRTSRSHLLAGLRTAPKSATVPLNNHRQQHAGLDDSRYANFSGQNVERVPQTTMGAGFPQNTFDMRQDIGQEIDAIRQAIYTSPEHVLAPPSIDVGGEMPIDDKMYAELMSTNLFLAAQQQRLQQQLVSVTAAAQQFQNLSLGLTLDQQQQQIFPPSIPSMSLYQQQLQQGVQPMVQPVPGQHGLYSVYNPLTGQLNYVYDNAVQQDNGSLPVYQEEDLSPEPQVPTFRAEVSPPPESVVQSPVHLPVSVSPSPAASPSPSREMASLPPPSTHAFRRSHKKSSSFNPGLKPTINPVKANLGVVDGGPRSAALPPTATPGTGTFGPGQARAGEHPIRQPRGPPSLDDLFAKPTTKFEGSKNFATRQRRRAVHNLVRAGIERRGEIRNFGYHSSGGTNTPASEKEFAFSDGDDATVRSGSLSSKPSLGSLRAAANGAIGSERKERSSRERTSPDSQRSATPASEDSVLTGARFADLRLDNVASAGSAPSIASVVAGQRTVAQNSERRKTPMLVLSSAEKRKTMIM